MSTPSIVIIPWPRVLRIQPVQVTQRLLAALGDDGAGDDGHGDQGEGSREEGNAGNDGSIALDGLRVQREEIDGTVESATRSSWRGRTGTPAARAPWPRGSPTRKPGYRRRSSRAKCRGQCQRSRLPTSKGPHGKLLGGGGAARCVVHMHRTVSDHGGPGTPHFVFKLLAHHAHLRIE